MKLLQFELKKIIFSKRFLYLMAFIILCISALFLRNHIFQVTIEKEREQHILSMIQEGQRTISELQLALEVTPQDEIAKTKIVKMDQIINTLYNVQKALDAGDWQQELQLENHFLTQLQEYKSTDEEFSILNEDIKKTLALNAEHLATNVKPEHETYSTALPNFMKQIVDIFVNFGAILVLLIMVGDILTKEFKQRSIQFLYTQPLKKSAILHSKFWCAVVIYGVITLCSLLVAGGISLLFGEQGTFSYPVLLEQNDMFSFMTIKEYLIFALVSVTAMILLVLVLCLFVSLMFKHTLVSLLTVLVLLLGGYTLFEQLSFTSIDWLNPFQYVLVKETIGAMGYNWYKGIGITIAVALLCYLLSIWRIRFVRMLT